MRAMILEEQGRPLRLVELSRPKPAAGEVLLRVGAYCGGLGYEGPEPRSSLCFPDGRSGYEHRGYRYSGATAGCEGNHYPDHKRYGLGPALRTGSGLGLQPGLFRQRTRTFL